MHNNKKIFNEKKILVTGNSGFKGAWLTLYLNKISNAKLFGFSDKCNWSRGIFNKSNISKYAEQYWGDIKDFKKVKYVITKIKPDIIFHFAAQPIVSHGYINAKDTYETNFNGTLNLLESIKKINKKIYVIVITSDKVYRNNIISKTLSENSSLGGICPYSSSKACVEILAETYSLICKDIFINTVRSGNVIGGGDWSENRIIPDIFRAYSNNKFIKIRNPNAIRPWSYVLDIVRGYVNTAENLIEKKDKSFNSFNFSSDIPFKSVNDISKKILKILKNKIQILYDPLFLGKEAESIILSNKKAKRELGWNPIYKENDMIKSTTQWYQNVINGACPLNISEELLTMYLRDFYKLNNIENEKEIGRVNA